MENILRQVGQLMFFGFDGYEVNDHAREAICKYHMGNVILFTRNYRDAKQFYELIRDLQALAMEYNGKPLLVAIDQEGGSVVRMMHDATWFPGPMAMRVAGEPDLAYRLGQAVGREMAAYGLNLNLAPVVNMATNPNSPHAGARCFGADPESCAPWAISYIRGVQESVYATAKHYPGIGNSKVDLHLALGSNDRPLEELEKVELSPARVAVAAKVSTVMTSHEIYSAIDDQPCTLSHKLLNDYLRGKYGFEGTVISDCMQMGALSRTIPTPIACVRAVQAGVDLLLVCHTRQVQIDSTMALAEAVENGTITQGRLHDALARIEKMKSGLKFPEKCPDTQAEFAKNRELAKYACEKALTVIGSAEDLRCNENEKFLLLAPPPVALTLVDEQIGEAHLAKTVGETYRNAKCIEYPIPMDDTTLKELCKEMESFDKVIIGTYNAHTELQQQKLMEYANSLGKRVVGIALRTPMDARYYGSATAVLTYEYTPPMVVAVMEAMAGRLKPTGKLPDDVRTILDATK
jgi:beta-N-acetylhexosaminidase